MIHVTTLQLENVSLPVHPPRLNRHKQEPRGFILYLITRCTPELQMIHVCFQFYFDLGLNIVFMT